MKALMYSTAIVALSVTAAVASGPEVPMEPPVIVPVETGTDWGGVYFGAFAGVHRGPMFDIGGPWPLNAGSNSMGLMLGYRHDFGSFVGGVELATTTGVDMAQAGFPTWMFTDMTDARVMAGYEVGRALVFGSVGYTTSTFMAAGPLHNYNGWNAGIGVDYLVSDNVFLGGEFVHRRLQSTTTAGWTGRFNSVQVRGGIIF